MFSADLNLWTFRFIFRILILFKRWSIGHSRCLRSKWGEASGSGHVPKHHIDFSKRRSYTHSAAKSLEKAFRICNYNKSRAIILLLSPIIFFNFAVTYLAGMGSLQCCASLASTDTCQWAGFNMAIQCCVAWKQAEGPQIRRYEWLDKETNCGNGWALHIIVLIKQIKKKGREQWNAMKWRRPW